LQPVIDPNSPVTSELGGGAKQLPEHQENVDAQNSKHPSWWAEDRQGISVEIAILLSLASFDPKFTCSTAPPSVRFSCTWR